jgi:hypothetical protein
MKKKDKKTRFPKPLAAPARADLAEDAAVKVGIRQADRA